MFCIQIRAMKKYLLWISIIDCTFVCCTTMPDSNIKEDVIQAGDTPSRRKRDTGNYYPNTTYVYTFNILPVFLLILIHAYIYESIV